MLSACLVPCTCACCHTDLDLSAWQVPPPPPTAQSARVSKQPSGMNGTALPQSQLPHAFQASQQAAPVAAQHAQPAPNLERPMQPVSMSFKPKTGPRTVSLDMPASLRMISDQPGNAKSQQSAKTAPMQPDPQLTRQQQQQQHALAGQPGQGNAGQSSSNGRHSRAHGDLQTQQNGKLSPAALPGLGRQHSKAAPSSPELQLVSTQQAPGSDDDERSMAEIYGLGEAQPVVPVPPQAASLVEQLGTAPTLQQGSALHGGHARSKVAAVRASSPGTASPGRLPDLASTLSAQAEASAAAQTAMLPSRSPSPMPLTQPEAAKRRQQQLSGKHRLHSGSSRPPFPPAEAAGQLRRAASSVLPPAAAAQPSSNAAAVAAKVGSQVCTHT